jgi:hypothetical protein
MPLGTGLRALPTMTNKVGKTKGNGRCGATQQRADDGTVDASMEAA